MSGVIKADVCWTALQCWSWLDQGDLQPDHLQCPLLDHGRLDALGIHRRDLSYIVEPICPIDSPIALALEGVLIQSQDLYRNFFELYVDLQFIAHILIYPVHDCIQPNDAF